jgi:hypothetical protein
MLAKLWFSTHFWIASGRASHGISIDDGNFADPAN